MLLILANVHLSLNLRLCARSLKLLSSHKSKTSPSCPAVLTQGLFSYSRFNLYSPESSSHSQECNNHDKAIASLENPPFYKLRSLTDCLSSHWTVSVSWRRSSGWSNVSLKCHSTEDNLSSLNDITKQFWQSDGTATVYWLIPALTSLIFLFQTLCYNHNMSVYIFWVYISMQI